MAEVFVPLSHDERDLIERAHALLDDPAHAGHPMRPVLLELLARNEEQRGRLEKLLRISDGYHSVSRTQNLDLIREYDRQIMRLEKLARISDRYQSQLLHLNEELKALTLRDPLTGVGNRRYMSERLCEEVERASRLGAGFSLAVLDIDHFKNVNDVHGHEVGDEVLCRVAEVVRATLRDYDVFARWGGEEFVIALPESALATATTVCQRVREAVESLRIERRDTAISVTISLGLTEHRNGEPPTDTINRADVALRQAKAAGRNRLETI
ncbi:MAG: biofilm regulation diguanylate cyclase SiaD [Zoogloeaceae bacterium]|nr:biofilm regulation diguanylate cyclase SiaD [Zoogloeaceae bacterium]